MIFVLFSFSHLISGYAGIPLQPHTPGSALRHREEEDETGQRLSELDILLNLNLIINDVSVYHMSDGSS